MLAYDRDLVCETGTERLTAMRVCPQTPTPMRRIPIALFALSTVVLSPGLTARGQAPTMDAPSGRFLVPIQRPPELKQEYFRAERAWHTGSSLIEARARLDRVLLRLPDDHEALRLRARVSMDLDRTADALLDARRAVTLIETDPDAWLLLAETSLRANDPESALEAMEQAASRVDERPDDHLRLSWIAQELGFLDRAETHARVGLAMDAPRPAALRRLAHVFMAQNRPDDAARLLARALDEGSCRIDLVTTDPVLEPLGAHPLLARWF